MAKKFAEIAFTPLVKATQERYGSRELNVRFEQSDDPRDRLTPAEAEFISQRDGFYQSTVSETGWPYVQFRGGPVGFLKILDERTLAYADFRGNVQYVSVGNMSADARISLILMDYANRRRLKIWARAEIIERHDAPKLVRQLGHPDYKARIERAVLLHIEALDWNCPQHITPRYTGAEVELLIAPLQRRIAELEAALDGRSDG